MNAFGASSVLTKAPEKGSFPLDHYGECKTFMKEFMTCLKENQGSSSACKTVSKAYLECRMEKGLMQQENLSALGLDSNSQLPKASSSQEGRKEAEGFIAGLGVKGKRYHE